MSDPDTPPADSLRAFLANRDAPCPCCHYNLRALPGSRCPECNQELHLVVGLVEPRIGAYLGALCGLLAGIGMAAVFLGIVGYMMLTRGGPPRNRELWTIFGIPTLSIAVLSVLLALALRRPVRTWFRTAPWPSRLLGVLAGWAATAACVVWFMWAIFRL
jgi:hypothetical protein